MSDFVRMDHVPIKSVSAAASLSIADANYDGVELYDTNRISTKNHFLTWLAGLLAFSAITVGLLAMWIEASLVVYIAFAAPLITGPMILAQRRKLQWLPTFQEEESKLRLDVNTLAAQRVQLAIEFRRMSRQVQRMSDVQHRFEYLVEREGRDVVYFENLIKENAKIQSEIQKARATRDLMDLISVILSSDRNGDDIVSHKESEQFIHKLKAFAGRNGQLLNEEIIREAFQKSMNNPATTFGAASMLHIVQSALSDDEESHKNKYGYRAQQNRDSSSYYKHNQEVEDDGFVYLNKPPRVAPTGLVLPNSMEEEEGNLAHPIRVEDYMRYDDDVELNQAPSQDEASQ